MQTLSLLKGSLLSIFVSATVSAAGADYYQSVDESSGAAMRETLHEVIDDHTFYPYTSSSTDTWDILEQADEDPKDPGKVLDVYKNARYAKAGGGNNNYNREHVWPRSYGFPSSDSLPYTDCHHLHISDSSYNSLRGNRVFRNCSAGCTEYTTLTYNNQGGPGQSNWGKGSGASGSWETWPGRRGDIARTMFYLDIRYEGGTHLPSGKSEPQLVLTDDEALIVTSSSNQSTAYMGMRSVLIEWHLDDPVDDAERLRNEVVYNYQGNRNPFVDHPQWVACIYQDDCASPPPSPDLVPWINEIHYDNTGTDTGEGIEILGPAGLDLNGWSLVGYNGRNDLAYRTVELGGILPNQSAGYGAAWFAFLGLQNGAPDGVALVDPGGNVIEFLSYEGSFTASDGPAAGMPSTNIGVVESRDTPVGYSLQRAGSGSIADDFTWQAPLSHTQGVVNWEQSFTP